MDSKEKMDRVYGSNMEAFEQNDEENENYVYLGEFWKSPNLQQDYPFADMTLKKMG